MYAIRVFVHELFEQHRCIRHKYAGIFLTVSQVLWLHDLNRVHTIKTMGD